LLRTQILERAAFGGFFVSVGRLTSRCGQCLDGIAGGPRPIGVKVAAFSHDVIVAAAREREITFTTYGRKTGKPSDVTILVVTDGERLFILSGRGMARHWPQNLVARGEGILHLGGIDVKVKSRHVTDPDEARTIDAHDRSCQSWFSGIRGRAPLRASVPIGCVL